jgi:DNA-binding beta-propeller fold protein YncE
MTQQITDYAGRRRKHDRVRKIVLLAALVVLLMLLLWSAMYYASNRELPFPALTTIGNDDAEVTPEFLYAISGPEGEHTLVKPVGVAVSEDGRVFVVDAMNRVVRAFTEDGDYLFSFNSVVSSRGSSLRLPQRVAIGPDGNVWVTDRHLKGIFVFSPENGAFIREFVPDSDAYASWGPVALSFDEDANLYVADLGVSSNHQILVFNPDGTEKARWGTTVQTTNMTDSPSGFYFPNGIAFSEEGEVFISDMSNHRVQVFSPEGQFKRFIYTSGSPLGLVIDREQRLCVVDPFSHSVDVYELTGERIAGFGAPGVGIGQFRFPSDIALDETGRMFISDRENNQVQVWGWPSGIIPPVVLPEEPAEWGICLSPLLLLLLPLLRRRTAFFATEDFLLAMGAAGAVDQMDDRHFRWIVTEELYQRYIRKVAGDVRFEDLLTGEPHSRVDVEDFIARSGADEATAIALTMAERIGRIATEDPALSESATALGIRVVDRERFLREYAGRRRGRAARRRSEHE